MSAPLSAFAPGRVELLGNHTDYNRGVVLAAAIDRGISISGGSREDEIIELISETLGDRLRISLSEIVPQKEDSWANYPLGVVREFLRAGHRVSGFAARISSDLPLGGGLSSSAALEVATAYFLAKANGLALAPMEIAKLCQRAENEFVGVRSGLLDQATSVFGRRGEIVYLDCLTNDVSTFPFPAGLALVIAESGGQHNLLTSFYNQRRAECAAAAAALGVDSLRELNPEKLEESRGRLDPLLFRRAAHIVYENDRVWRAVAAMKKGDAPEIGALLIASHESSRTNFENSTPELDTLVEMARTLPGVLGARLTGGGFGGSCVVLVRENDAASATEKLNAQFLARTGRPPNAFVCQISDGAAARNPL